MTRDDIIRMAREARGYPAAPTDGSLWLFSESHLERFANLVAAQEREKVAAWMIQRGYATGHGDTMVELLKELEWQIAERIAAERESIAAWVASQRNDVPATGLEISAAIRARGEK